MPDIIGIDSQVTDPILADELRQIKLAINDLYSLILGKMPVAAKDARLDVITKIETVITEAKDALKDI